MSDFGSSLREFRKHRGWTQQQLADEVGATQSTISQLESGEKNPSFELVRELSGVLGITVGELLGEGPQELEPEEVAHFRTLRQLPPAAVAELKSYAAFLRQKHARKEKDG